MSTTDNQDETASFVTTSSDMPDETPQEELTQEEQEGSESDTQEGEESQQEEDASGSDSETAAQDEGKKPNRVQKRIDKVVREREDERRKNEALTKRIAELEGKGPDKADKVNDAGAEPVEKDFKTYDDYLDALDAYDGKQESAQDKPEVKNDEQENTSSLTDNQKTAMAVIRESIDSANKPADFDAVALNPDVSITGDMLEALAECEDPAKVMYHLGQNKSLADEIASGSPAQQMRAIAKLDLTVTSKPPKPTKTTNAPDPISPVGGSDVQEKAPSEMSFAEYEAHMNKKERTRKSW